MGGMRTVTSWDDQQIVRAGAQIIARAGADMIRQHTQGFVAHGAAMNMEDNLGRMRYVMNGPEVRQWTL